MKVRDHQVFNKLNSTSYTLRKETLRSLESIEHICKYDKLLSEMSVYFIEQSRQAQSRSNQEKQVSVGLELEFFLRGRGGFLASKEEACEFMQTLAIYPGWKLLGKSFGGEHSWVSFDIDKRRYTKVKFEFFPHLLELSLTYFFDLNSLYQHLSEMLSLLHETAERLSLAIDARESVSRSELSNEFDAYRVVDSSRDKFMRRMYSLPESQEVCEFPAMLASLQIQIGGLKWWKDDCMMHKLYEIEASIFLNSYFALTADFNEAVQLYEHRLRLYYACFPGFPLIGVPPLENWSISSWMRAMLFGPLSDADGANIGLRIVDMDPKKLSGSIVSKARDFQLIRPRLIGTLEFRGEPSTSNINIIMRAVASRFAAALAAQSLTGKASTLGHSRRRWKDLRKGIPDRLRDSTSLALFTLLKERNLSEERFL